MNIAQVLLCHFYKEKQLLCLHVYICGRGSHSLSGRLLKEVISPIGRISKSGSPSGRAAIMKMAALRFLNVYQFTLTVRIVTIIG